MFKRYNKNSRADLISIKDFCFDFCEKLYLIGEKNGTILTATESEIINNALQQEKDGINPHFAFYDYKNQRPVTNKGWLVWSSFNHGCGVVYRRHDGKMVIVTGVQSDFAYM